MYFNRFRIIREDGLIIIHFGLDCASEGLLDHYSCAVTSVTLDQNQDSLLNYLKNTSRPTEKAPAWNRVFPPGQVAVVDIFQMSSIGDRSETILCFFSMIAANEAVREKKQTIPGTYHILLRSSRVIQAQLIAALYES